MFLACDDNILNSLESLGYQDLEQEVYDQLERFFCKLYNSSVYTKVNNLRWFWYSNRAAEGESLPTTTGSLTLHIQRANYIAMIQRKDAKLHLCFPSPVEYEWKFDSSKHRYIPARCQNPPVPAAGMSLEKCGCKRGCRGSVVVRITILHAQKCVAV